MSCPDKSFVPVLALVPIFLRRNFGQSRADFYSKMCIAQKEAIETEYWLRLLYEGEYLSGREFESITRDLNEVLSLLHAICKKTRSNLNLA